MVKNDTNEFLDLARLYHAKLIAEAFELYRGYQQKLLSKSVKLINQDKRGYCLFIGAETLKKMTIQQLEEMINEPFIQIIKVRLGLFWVIV